MAMLSLDNPTFERFAFYSGIAIGKTLLMSALTVRSRLTNKVRTTALYTGFISLWQNIIETNAYAVIYKYNVYIYINTNEFVLTGGWRLIHYSACNNMQEGQNTFLVFTA